MRTKKRLFRVVGGIAASAALVAVAAVTARAIWFAGPYQSPTALPAQRVVDLHVHTAGIGVGDSGCFVRRPAAKLQVCDRRSLGRNLQGGSAMVTISRSSIRLWCRRGISQSI